MKNVAINHSLCLFEDMRELKLYYFILFIGTALAAVAIIPFFKANQTDQQDFYLASYTYKGPTKSIPGDPHLVRVEVIVKDSPEAGGAQIQSVVFNGEKIPLQPRDIYGNRGLASFQVAPGKYMITWVVQRDKLLWPRFLTNENEVTIDPRDLWLQISIEGEEISIL